MYKLDGELIYKELTKQFNGAFSRLFDSEYKNLIKKLKFCKKDGKKPSYAEALLSVESLAYFQQNKLGLCRRANENNEGNVFKMRFIW